MWKFIHGLQNKPERERKKILILSTAALTLIILAFWVISFQHSFKVSQQKINSSDKGSPLETIKTGWSTFYQGLMGDSATSTATSSATSTLNSTSTEAQ